MPPSWKDFGKPLSDLLSKDYPLGISELQVKTRAPNGVLFKAGVLKDNTKQAILGDIEGKYVDGKNGLVLTQTWLTNNSLKTLVELDGQVAKGKAHCRIRGLHSDCSHTRWPHHHHRAAHV